MYFYNEKSSYKMGSLIDRLLVIFIGVLLPAKIYILIVGAVIALDTYYGIKASKKKENKVDIFKLLDGVIMKIQRYTPIVVAVYWLDTMILQDMIISWVPIELVITKIVTFIVLMREFASIDRNWGTITGRKLSQGGGELLSKAKKVKEKIKKVL